jgi:hypothetical protein
LHNIDPVSGLDDEQIGSNPQVYKNVGCRMTKKGVSTSMRRLFAVNSVNACYRDISPVRQPMVKVWISQGSATGDVQGEPPFSEST